MVSVIGITHARVEIPLPAQAHARRGILSARAKGPLNEARRRAPRETIHPGRGLKTPGPTQNKNTSFTRKQQQATTSNRK